MIGDLTSSLNAQLQQLESMVMDAKLTLKTAETEVSLIKCFTIFVIRSKTRVLWPDSDCSSVFVQIFRVKKCMRLVNTLQTESSPER